MEQGGNKNNKQVSVYTCDLIFWIILEIVNVSLRVNIILGNN